MKYVFLVFGLCVGVFWSQIYEMAGQLVNTYIPGAYNVATGHGAVLKQIKPGHEVKRYSAARKAGFVVTENSAKVTVGSAANYPDVIMYGTDWCPYCKKARTYFKSNGINFVEYNIEKNDLAKRMYDLLGGGGVPLILVHGKKMKGFNIQHFRDLYGS